MGRCFCSGPNGGKGLLIPIRVQECDLQGLLPQVIYVDLVGVTEHEARARLLAGVYRGRAKPRTKPVFPPSPRSVVNRPAFPGKTGRSIPVKWLVVIAAIVAVTIVALYFRKPLIGNLLSSSNSTAGRPSSRLVLIFSDTTRSLSEPEIKKVSSLTADIIDSLPEKTQYAVYTVQRYVSQPPLFPSGFVPELKTLSDRSVYDNQKATRRTKIEHDIDELYSNSKYKDASDRTCILNLLPFIQERFARMTASGDPSNHEFEVYFVSDMVENCDDTALGRIRMDDVHMRDLILSYAEKYSDGPNLSNVRITVIIPSTFESNHPFDPKPSTNFLKAFWRKIFFRCGLKEEWFWDQKHIDWISNGELPDRLRQPS